MTIQDEHRDAHVCPHRVSAPESKTIPSCLLPFACQEKNSAGVEDTPTSFV